MATVDFADPKSLRKRFHELSAQVAKIEAKLAPLFEELSAALDGPQDKEAEIRSRIVKVREGMYEMEMERAALARALGGKTGDPEEE